MIYFALLAIAIGIGLGIAAVGCGLAQGKAIASAMEGMARQPESAGAIQTAMIIGLAFIEALTIYALVISFMLIGKLPETSKVLEVIEHVVK
jgi:F-type H+-transporting ATPase subunit c